MPVKKRRRPPGRPKAGSDAIVRAVLDATLDRLASGALDALRIEDVARAAGVHKTSIYRRWPTTADLVLAALAAQREKAPPFVETGSLRDDLVALLHAKTHAFSTARRRRIARALMAVGDAGSTKLAAALRHRQYALPTARLETAVARGELPRGTDAAFVAEMLYGPVLQRLLVDEKVDDAFLRKVVDSVLAGFGVGRTR